MAAKKKTENGRNPDGTFKEGNPGGPGRPARATETVYMQILMDACPPDKWKEICQVAVSAARNGDDKARAWLTSYLMGTPHPRLVARKPSDVAALDMHGTTEIDDLARAMVEHKRDKFFQDVGLT